MNDLTLEELAVKCPIAFKDIKELMHSSKTLGDTMEALAVMQYLYAQAMVNEREKYKLIA